VRDLTAALLSEACTGVSIEPSLQSLEDEQLNHRSANCNDEARLDIRASDFWIKGREALFDERVFYPIAPSYRQKDLAAVYRLHENEKKRCYGQRVRDVEMASFTPLVFASTGGMAKECTVFFKRLADILADREEKDCLPKNDVFDSLQDFFLSPSISHPSNQGDQIPIQCLLPDRFPSDVCGVPCSALTEYCTYMCVCCTAYFVCTVPYMCMCSVAVCWYCIILSYTCIHDLCR
jgi:hypothetical protein